MNSVYQFIRSKDMAIHPDFPSSITNHLTPNPKQTEKRSYMRTVVTTNETGYQTQVLNQGVLRYHNNHKYNVGKSKKGS